MQNNYHNYVISGLKFYHDFIQTYELKPREARIFLELTIRCYDGNGTCFLTKGEIQNFCNTGRDTTRTTLKKFVELSFFQRTSRNGTGHDYTIHPDHIKKYPILNSVHPHTEISQSDIDPILNSALPCTEISTGVDVPALKPVRVNGSQEPENQGGILNSVPPFNNNNNNLSLSLKKKKEVSIVNGNHIKIIHELTGGKFHKDIIGEFLQDQWAGYDPENVIFPAIKATIQNKGGLQDINGLKYFTGEVKRTYTSISKQFVDKPAEKVSMTDKDCEPNETMKLAKQDLKKQIGDASYKSWIQNKIFCLEYNESTGVLHLGFDKKFTKEWVMKDYRNQLERCFMKNFDGYASMELSVITKEQLEQFMNANDNKMTGGIDQYENQYKSTCPMKEIRAKIRQEIGDESYENLMMETHYLGYNNSYDVLHIGFESDSQKSCVLDMPHVGISDKLKQYCKQKFPKLKEICGITLSKDQIEANRIYYELDIESELERRFYEQGTDFQKIIKKREIHRQSSRNKLVSNDTFKEESVSIQTGVK